MTEPMEADGKAALDAQRRRRQQYRTGFVTFVACGIVATIGNAAFGVDLMPRVLMQPMSPALAIGLAAGFLATLLIVGWLGRGVLDEHEVASCAFGQAAACGIVVVAYPVWFLLWKGGLAQEPSHVMLFAILLLASWIGYAYKKYF